MTTRSPTVRQISGATTVTPSVCRTCHNNCAVLVEVGPDGRAMSLKGDKDNPLYGGYTCVKGRTTPEFLSSPRRLRRSLKRMPDGTLQPVAVEEALDDIAARLQRLVDEHGPRSVAHYFGTAAHPGSFWVLGPTAAGFLDAIGTPMRFSSETIDQPGKALSLGCHGWWMAAGTGNIDPDAVMLVGVNPVVSHNGLPFGNPNQWIKRQTARGMQLIVVDPRRTETAQRAAIHLQCRPGHDVEILAAMLRVILDEDRYDAAFLAENADGLETLRAALRPFDPADVARRAELEVDDLVRAARTYAGASRGYVYCATGPSMSGPSTLIEYLRLNLITLCGHWQREGDPVGNVGVGIPEVRPKAQAYPPFPSYGASVGERSRIRGLGATMGGMPTATLAEEILTPGEGQVRALLACAGNPALAWPDQQRTVDALRSLELLVSVDVTLSQTGRLSDYVIATTMPLEVPGYTHMADWCFAAPGVAAAIPYGQYAPALSALPEDSELLEEWQFYYEIAKRMGITLTMGPKMEGPPWGTKSTERYTFDMERRPTTDELLEQHLRSTRVSLDELKRHPHGAFFPSDARVLPKDEGWEGRLDLANADMMADLAAEAARAAGGDSAEDDAAYPLRLISRRLKHMYNSAFNLPSANRGRPYNPACLHPADLERLGLHDGDIVEIRSPHGAIPGVATADDTVHIGLVSMTHCYGGLPEHDVELLEIGSPTARLCSVEDDFERYSGQPRMSNIPVAVRAIDLETWTASGEGSQLRAG